MANYPKIFVIIVTYKGHLWYERCFTSLRNSAYPVQMIVIDNASNDGTLEYIREHFPEIHLIESKENLGFGRANNMGMRYALDNDCDYVFLLNQDAWIEPNTIGELVRVAEKYPEYGILSPLHVTKEKDRIEPNFISFISYYTSTSQSIINDLYFGQLKEVYTNRYANAAGWLLPRKALEEIGGFCPLIYHYGEDDDYLNRLHYHNMKLGICPNARMVHDAMVKSDFSISLNQKARLLDVDEIIDVNSVISIKRQCFIFLKRCVRSALMCRKLESVENFLKLKFILQNYKKIQYCIRMHKEKQSCWL